MGLNFFGITHNNAPQIRKNLFTQIHEIVFHGKGGYDWETVYSMPRWLRQFTFNQIDKFYIKQKEEQDKNSQNSNKIKNLIDSEGNIDYKSIPSQFKNKKSPPRYK